MKVTFNKAVKSKSKRGHVDYIVLGIISQVKASFYKTPIIIRNEFDLLTYINPESKNYEELKELIKIGVTIIINNSFEDEKRFHSWLTPVKDYKVITTFHSNDDTLEILRSPHTFEGETYIVKIYYDPNELPTEGNFYVNLPSGKIIHGIDNEFVTSLSFHTGHLPSYVDLYNDIFDGVVSGSNLGEIFDDIQTYFTLEGGSPSVMEYITPYLSKDAENDKVNGVFTVYYNRPVKYLPKTIHPDSLRISYSYFDNNQYLENYIPKGTVTFHSKLLGNSSKLRVRHKEGTLIITLGSTYEEFEVSGKIDSGKFIGDVKSKLVSIVINTDTPEDIVIPDFDEYFHPVSDLSNADIDINGSIQNLLDSELKVNAIILSDTLVNFDLNSVDTSRLDREFLFTCINSTENLDQLKLYPNNTLKFTGKVNGFPSYISFVDSMYNCEFSNLVSGIVETSDQLDFSVYDVWNPQVDEFYNYLEVQELSNFIRDLKLPISKITIFHLFYIMALSLFILRYKGKLLFVTPTATMARLRSLISDFSRKFKIINSVRILDSEVKENNVSVSLSTKLISILKYNEIFLNFKLNF